MHKRSSFLYQYQKEMYEIYKSSLFPKFADNCFKKPAINLKNIYRQECLPSPLLRYILNSANSTLLQKLHATCKYFYFLQPAQFCKKIYVSERIKSSNMDRHNIVISHSETKKIVIFKNLYLTDNLTCYREECDWGEPDASKVDQNFVSSLIARMYKCEVSELIIPYQNLTLKEFEFLICSGKVTYLNMRGATIVDENGKKLPHVLILMALYKYHCKLSLSSQF